MSERGAATASIGEFAIARRAYRGGAAAARARLPRMSKPIRPTRSKGSIEVLRPGAGIVAAAADVRRRRVRRRLGLLHAILGRGDRLSAQCRRAAATTAGRPSPCRPSSSCVLFARRGGFLRPFSSSAGCRCSIIRSSTARGFRARLAGPFLPVRRGARPAASTPQRVRAIFERLRRRARSPRCPR